VRYDSLPSSFFIHSLFFLTHSLFLILYSSFFIPWLLYMTGSIYENPSFYAHVINGSLLLSAFILFCKNYSKIRGIEPYKLVMMVLLFSLVSGVHGISHMGLEKLYHYNPLQGLIF